MPSGRCFRSKVSGRFEPGEALADRRLQHVRPERLRQVAGAGDGPALAGIARDVDDRQLGIACPGFLGDFPAADAAQPDIGDQQVDLVLVEQVQRFLSAVRLDRSSSELFDAVGQHHPDERLVVDAENIRSRHQRIAIPRSDQTHNRRRNDPRRISNAVMPAPTLLRLTRSS